MKQILRAIPISLCISFMASSHVLAQKTYAIGLGGGTAIPVGKLKDAQKAGYNGIAMLAMRGQNRSTPIAFGPFLAAAGWLMLMFGQELVMGYLGLFALRP